MTTPSLYRSTSHCLPASLVGRRLHVLVVGCGGTGTAVAGGLVYLHKSLLAYGHRGLSVTLQDGDVISSTNVVRQPFAACEVGQYKSTVLANRTNVFHGTQWEAITTPFPVGQTYSRPDIIIGCVDTRAARKAIHQYVTARDAQVAYWLDFGNNAASGQFILGQPKNAVNRALPERLPTIAELCPEIICAAADDRDTLPSCSALEALERQEPFINQTLAYSALAMLARLLRYGRVPYYGAFIDVAEGTVGFERPSQSSNPSRRSGRIMAQRARVR